MPHAAFSQRTTCPPRTAVRQSLDGAHHLQLAKTHDGRGWRHAKRHRGRGRCPRPPELDGTRRSRYAGGFRGPGERQPIERARDLAQHLARHMRIARRRIELRMADHHLDDANVDALLQQMRGERVPQRMGRRRASRCRWRWPCRTHTVDVPGRHRLDRIAAGEQPRRRALDHPPLAQQLEKPRRQHGIAVLAALALFDAQNHARTVDVRDLQVRDFRDAQAGAVGDAEDGAELWPRRRGHQSCRFLLGQDDRQLLRLLDDTQILAKLGPVAGECEEEPQRRHRAVDRRRL